MPTEAVEARLRQTGRHCPEIWLDVHERFAGYVEPIGADQAVWGLAHVSPQWLAPLEVDVDDDDGKGSALVTCADAHPSYRYQLDERGEFLGFPAEEFVVHVERAAAGWAFGSGGATRALTQSELRAPEVVGRLASADVLEPASDRFSRDLRAPELLVVWRVEAAFPRRGWLRA